MRKEESQGGRDTAESRHTQSGRRTRRRNGGNCFGCAERLPCLEHDSAANLAANLKDRIVRVARELNYRPNFFAQTLRRKRTFTVGVIANEIGDPYSGAIIAGVESFLRDREYFS